MPVFQDLIAKTSRRVVGRHRLHDGHDCAVGSDDTQPICVSGKGVAPAHARFLSAHGTVYVEPIDAAPVVLNGQPISGRVKVEDGDWLVFGAASFQVLLPRAAESGSEAGAGESIGLQSGAQPKPVVVGRDRQCDLVIDSPLISREHARLLATPEGLLLQDLRSTNGTFVNGQRIVGDALLRPGDRVSFATFVYRFTGAALEPAESGGRVRIEARGLTKTVVDRTTKQPRNLLDAIDLAIEPGEFVVIFGTSGSGKSKLMEGNRGPTTNTVIRPLWEPGLATTGAGRPGDRKGAPYSLGRQTAHIGLSSDHEEVRMELREERSAQVGARHLFRRNHPEYPVGK